MRSSWALVAVFVLAVSWGTKPPTVAGQEDDHHHSTYPEEVHRLVMERLRQRNHNRDGSWGAWAPWSSCSRSCGGGVMTQSRECVNGRKRSRGRAVKNTPTGGNGGDGGGKRCVGRYKRFQLCNTQTCPGVPTDFRRQQCESFNNTPFNDRTYDWEPYYESLSSCALNCRAVGLSFYATLNQTVIDGTPCGHTNENSICVAGKCMSVGCDGILGSGRVLDKCGACGGDNSTCRVIEGSYSKPRLPYGYNLLLTLPTGASNISVLQAAPSANYLALREPGGDYILRGGRNVNGTVVSSAEAAGALFTYRPAGALQGDGLTARGPIQHPLDIMLYWEVLNLGVQYRYELSAPSTSQRGRTNSYLPRPTLPETDVHTDRHLDNPLNPLVPGGPASRVYPSGPVNDARSGSSGPFVFDAIHSQQEEKEREEKEKKAARKAKGRPEEEQLRRRRPKKRGPYEWKVAGFTPCSKTCGGGIQATHVICVRKRRSTQVPEQNCYSIPKPASQTVRCNLKPCPPQWGADEWGSCSVSCGMGVQTRKLLCKQAVSDDTDIVMPDAECVGPADLPAAQVCHRPACEGSPRWETGEWSDCTTQCGLGTRQRRVTCMAGGKNVPHIHCTDARPSDQEMCDMGSCATRTWFTSTWEEHCSASCGTGRQKRRVYCSEDPVATKLSCDVNMRPNDTRSCNSDRGCNGKWFASAWSPCDAMCGGSGQQQRQVLCVSWGRRRYRIETDESHCRGETKPESLKMCEKHCDAQWFTSQWSECSAPCGGGVQRREVKCLDEKLKPSLQCSAASKPDTRQTCKEQDCIEDDDDGTELEEAEVPSRPPIVRPLEHRSSERGPPYHLRADSTTNLEHTNEIEVNDDGRLVAALQPQPARVAAPEGWCMDRMKNCNLVFKARLCRLKYYSKLCCRTCSPSSTPGG